MADNVVEFVEVESTSYDKGETHIGELLTKYSLAALADIANLCDSDANPFPAYRYYTYEKYVSEKDLAQKSKAKSMLKPPFAFDSNYKRVLVFLFNRLVSEVSSSELGGQDMNNREVTKAKLSAVDTETHYSLYIMKFVDTYSSYFRHTLKNAGDTKRYFGGCIDASLGKKYSNNSALLGAVKDLFDMFVKCVAWYVSGVQWEEKKSRLCKPQMRAMLRVTGMPQDWIDAVEESVPAAEKKKSSKKSKGDETAEEVVETEDITEESLSESIANAANDLAM